MKKTPIIGCKYYQGVNETNGTLIYGKLYFAYFPIIFLNELLGDK